MSEPFWTEEKWRAADNKMPSIAPSVYAFDLFMTAMVAQGSKQLETMMTFLAEPVRQPVQSRTKQ